MCLNSVIHASVSHNEKGQTKLRNFWVVGAGGLVGSSVAKFMDGTQHSANIDWADSTGVHNSLCREADRFVSGVGKGAEWTIVWAAGKAVVSSDACEVESEVAMLSVLLNHLRASPLVPSTGRIAFTSSAGAVYAGGSNPPFDESSPAYASSEYGRGKLVQEGLIKTFAESTGVRASIARVASVYGPRQDLEKPQGLISHLCRAAIEQRPAEIFVPLDTRRHYIFAEDMGRRFEQFLSGSSEDGALVTIKNIFSEPAVDIRRVIEFVEAAHGGKIELMVRSNNGGARYPADVTLKSVIEPHFERTDDLTLDRGVAITYAAMSNK